MIFIKNKYYSLYYTIIDTRKSTPLPNNVRAEVHHIIPKCLGGDDSPENLVKLTPKEHFLCHKLLTKITNGVHARKMWFALNNFLRSSYKNPRDSLKITGKLYEEIKIKQAEFASLENKGVLFWNNGVEQVKSKDWPGDGFVRGRLMTQSRRWWTNGEKNKWVEKCPDNGWYLGKTVDSTKTKWTNGTVDIMSAECPGDGWYKGGRPHSEETKQKIREKRKLQRNVKGHIKH